MQNWTALECSACGSKEFIRTMHLKVHPTGGSTEEASGWKCSDCGTKVDIASLRQYADLKRKKQELATLEQEVAQASGQAIPKRPG